MCTICGCGNQPHEHDGLAPHTHVDAHVDAHAHAHADEHHHAHDLHDQRHVRDHEHRTVRIERDLLEKNNRLAEANRTELARRDVSMLNIIGGPGAGKTALLEATVTRMRRDVRLAVLEGDQATDRDAQRIERAGGRVLQINTDAGCHLDAAMVADGLRVIAPEPSSVLFVENVGNLVCPALFDIGERSKIVVMSVTEGEDKPLKYAHVFKAAKLFILTKTDLLPHLSFDAEQCIAWAQVVNPDLEVLRVSAMRGDGLDEWCDWVRGQMAS
jgi:hydrogenase nickel incorporation protein HypB